MKAVRQHTQFRRDLKRVKRSGDCFWDELATVIELLQKDLPLPERLVDHPLKGQWKPARECHLRPDLLLVYEKTDTAVILLRLGSHSELFR